MEKEPTFDASVSDKVITENYKPLMLDDTCTDIIQVNELLKHILNTLLNQNVSIRNWKKQKVINLRNDKEVFSFSFDEVCKSIIRNRKINHKEISFPVIMCVWLDSSIGISPQFNMPQNDSDDSLTFELTTFLGTAYPIKPRIDREGIALNTMQQTLQSEIIRIRNELVSNSNQLFDISGNWIVQLMTFFNIYVSLVDITLMQFYYKAKYDYKNMNWTFNEDIVGKTISRKFEDKIKWIGQITGKPLDNARDEMEVFNRIKSVRNHLNHFDPPVIAYTIEDVAEWLNSLNSLGMLLLKIREKMNANISENILEIILLQKVKFIPKDPGKIRHKQKSDVGYGSCFEKGI